MKPKIVTFGESLLRLAPPGFERLLQTPYFTASFGGAEANVAVALASFGMDAAYVTVLPEKHSIADAAIAELRRFGVDTSGIIRANGRLGIYYMEQGADQRAARVIYDREHSALAISKPGDIYWEKAFDGATWFHISGITPAISASAAALSLESMNKARAMGLTVSLDLNYRESLWKWGENPRDVLHEMIEAADILIANEEHLRMVLDLSAPAQLHELTEAVLTACSGVKAVIVGVRKSGSASQFKLSACLNDRDQFVTSREFNIAQAVDRIGSGDAFTAGLIYGWNQLSSRQEALDFAAAAGSFKHSIPGDFLRATVEEVQALLRGEQGGRIRR